MNTFINDPTQWKLIVIFLTLLWLGFSLWLHGRRIAEIQSHLDALELAKAKTAWIGTGGPGKGKEMN